MTLNETVKPCKINSFSAAYFDLYIDHMQSKVLHIESAERYKHHIPVMKYCYLENGL
jgi:hypothetical protein